MKRYIDLSVTVNDATLSPPSTNALPKRRVDFAAPFYGIAGTEGAPARFFATVD